MLWQAIGDLLPSAIGVALSPAPIIAVILLLATPRARGNGSAFALGWVVGLVAVSAIVLVLASGADDADSTSSTAVNWAKVAIGLLFFAMAAKQWKSRPAKDEVPEPPKWTKSIDSFSPGKALVVGAALSGINPKNIALTFASSASIAQAGLDGTESAIAVMVFVIVASLTVAGPVVFYLVAPAKAAEPLASIKVFMSEHNAVIMFVVLLLLGAKLLGNGIAGVAA